MKFFHVYNDKYFKGLVKKGFINKNSGFKIQHDFPMENSMKFNVFAAKGTNIYNLIKENKFPFYIDRLTGGTTYHYYKFDTNLLQEYRDMLGDWFLGIQLHESEGGYLGDLFHMQQKLGDVPWVLEEIIAEYMKKTYKNETENAENELNKYLKENKLNPIRTESGLYYLQTKSGNGENPQVGTQVKVHYTGKLLDGTVFDSSISRNEPIQFNLGVGQVIPGWDEGIRLMSKGEKGILFIPYYLGYGDRGAGAIPPFATLIFDVELVDF